MASTRIGGRVRCVEKCLLNLDGKIVECILENISVSGALLSCSTSIPDVHPGDRCGLHLCNNPAMCPQELACQIIRVASPRMGVRFL